MSNVVNLGAALAALAARKAQRAQYRNLEAHTSGYAGLGADAAATTPVPVRSVQQALSDLGFKVDVDGQDGPQTRRGITAFQQAAGLNATGVVDAETWTWMNTANALDFIEAAAKFTSNEIALKGGAPAARGNTAPPLVPVVMPPANASFVTKAQMWLMAPGQPFYKKPVTYVGAGAAALLLFFLLRKPAPSYPPTAPAR